MTSDDRKRGATAAELREQLMREDPALAEAWEAGEPRRRLSMALVAMRKSAGLTQRGLAAITGWKQPQVARMESATGPWPSREALHDYAGACGRTVGLVFAHPKSGGMHIDSTVAFGSDAPDHLLDRLADRQVRISGA